MPRMKFVTRTIACLLLAGAIFTSNLQAASGRPNIIYVLADDLGYGDLSCYGQKTLSTPNLDKLAKEGMRFTRHYAGSTVCAPSRCVLMTGLHTGHARIRGNGPGQLKSDDVTIATVLRKSGYTTGCFGKWGIGNPPPLDDPNRHGFDEFYGYVNMYHAHNYYPEWLVKNGKKVPLRNKLYEDWHEKRNGDREGAGIAKVAVDYAPALISKAAIQFIHDNRKKPFFLYYALNIPHANNEGGGEKRIDRNGMRVPAFGKFADKDWPAQEKGFAQMIDYIDQDIGKILKALKDRGIDDNTIVMFSSDNGPHQEGGHKMDFFDSNGPLRGMKRDLYEGGVRVPFIARWPGKIRPDATSDLLSGFQDIFPTLAQLGGASFPNKVDGISMVNELTGRPNRQQLHKHLYWEFYEKGGRVAVVNRDWKAVRLNIIKNPNAPIELYNLNDDIGEENNVADQHPDIVARMAAILKKEHVDPAE
ncbi:MAG: arylsulfatase A-like enzyme [Limisphaerales bacterium]|jgi:arylsulfatase A-like enzyme